MRIVFALLTGMLCIPAAFGVDPAPMFGTPSYFRKVFEKPDSRVELQAPVRLNDYIVDGKMELSLRSYIDLVLANYTDITVSKLTVETSRNNILRQQSIFDPSFFGSFTTTRTKSPANDVLAGASVQNVLVQPSIFRFNQMLETGTTYSVGFNTVKTSTNSSFALFNPALNANLAFNVTQPLLRNRGTYFTRLPVTIARSRLKVAESQVEDQIIRQLGNAENAYWDVIQARENLKVQEQGLGLADALLKRTQRELELGAISALDIYQPQAQYANYQILVTQARFRLAQTEDVVRRYIGADLDPAVRNLPLVLTEQTSLPNDLELDREALVEAAMRNRPDLRYGRQQLDADDLAIDFTGNQLKPDLRLTAQYGSAGRGGPFSQRSNVFAPDGTPSQIVSTVPGGFGDALDQLFGFGFPVYGFGVQLNLPIRDRRAAADHADALVNKRLDALRLRSAEQNARLEVVNAISQAESSKASVELARVALDLAQKRVDAEQKKYDLGTTTIFFLLDAQTQLNRSQSDLVNQTVNYRKNLVVLKRTTGELLQERGVVVK